MGVFLPLDALWTSHRLWGGRKCKFASFKSKRGACISLAHEIIFTRNFLSLRHSLLSHEAESFQKERFYLCRELETPSLNENLSSFLWFPLKFELWNAEIWKMDLSLQVGGGCNPLQVTDIHACAAVEKNIKKEKAWKKKNPCWERHRNFSIYPQNILVHWEELETSPGLCATADGKKHYFPPWSQGKSQTTADKSKCSEIWKYYKDGYGMLYWLRFYKSPLYFWRFRFYFILSPFLPCCLLYFLILTGTEHAKGRKGERAKSQ